MTFIIIFDTYTNIYQTTSFNLIAVPYILNSGRITVLNYIQLRTMNV